jgi:hypothetical protein
VDFLQVFGIGLLVAVWVLLYSFWREVDIYIIEHDGESPPETLFEIIERNKALRIIPVTARVDCEGEMNNIQPHSQVGML